MPCTIHSSSGRALRVALIIGLIAAAATWSTPGRAQAQPNTGTDPVKKPTSLSDIAPRSIKVDPCKAKDPPAYCSKR